MASWWLSIPYLRACALHDSDACALPTSLPNHQQTPQLQRGLLTWDTDDQGYRIQGSTRPTRATGTATVDGRVGVSRRIALPVQCTSVWLHSILTVHAGESHNCCPATLPALVSMTPQPPPIQGTWITRRPRMMRAIPQLDRRYLLLVPYRRCAPRPRLLRCDAGPGVPIRDVQFSTGHSFVRSAHSRRTECCS
ncbi:hypothetical protein BC834DRAFT_295934 [Gloeopeniophorella convolvens]|nr:hypothetical protein BC834DRAFT_295934 [Gloeopeniophorella convolvens]